MTRRLVGEHRLSNLPKLGVELIGQLDRHAFSITQADDFSLKARRIAAQTHIFTKVDLRVLVAQCPDQMGVFNPFSYKLF